MRGKKLAAGMLIVTVLAYGIPGWTAAAPIVNTGTAESGKATAAEKETAWATSSDAESYGDEKNIAQATPGNAGKEEYTNDENTNEESKDNARETETLKTDVAKINVSRTYGADGEYQMEAEDSSIAAYDNTTPNSDGKRMELQQNGSVTYDLSRITDFKTGKYLVSVHMNGNSTKVKLFVNDQELGLIEKDNSGWGYEDLKEYSYCWLELNPGDHLKIMEGEGQYTHMDWVKLSCLEADSDYWIEAEDASAVSYGENTKVHDDGDRVEVNSGGSLTFDFSKISGFTAGTYELHAGVNGKRTQWKVSIDDKEAGMMVSPGNEKWQKGTCVDVSLGTEIELSETSLLKLSDADGSWGHVDFI